PLTPTGFAEYGQVVAFPDAHVDLDATTVAANQGTARRLNFAAMLSNLRPVSSQVSPAARPNMVLFRCMPAETLPLRVRLLERHRWSTQAFMPLASTPLATGYLVVVAQNGPDDLPDLSTLAAFRASSAQGINYNAGIWHHPMVALDQVTDFMSLVWENGLAEEDCQEVSMPVHITVDI
ncbi:ureidoglycolate hydrolase, partial [Thamnocephalis sphaerospora]